MRIREICFLCSAVAALGLARQARPAAATSEKEVSGTLTVDGKALALEHAYLDVTDPDEPSVLLSDQALPPEAIPFIPEKLVKDLQLHAVAFSVSRKDGKLTNTFGKLYCPGHALGVGLGRVEDRAVLLTVDHLDSSHIDGAVKTAKAVELSYISYSFELKFRATAGKPKN